MKTAMECVSLYWKGVSGSATGKSPLYPEREVLTEEKSAWFVSPLLL
jgi:hypothetical protein